MGHKLKIVGWLSIGALAGALYEGKDLEKAGVTATYAFIGILGATLVQALLAISIIIAFLIALFVSSIFV